MHNNVAYFNRCVAHAHSATLIIVVFEVRRMERFAEQANIFDNFRADPRASPLRLTCQKYPIRITFLPEPLKFVRHEPGMESRAPERTDTSRGFLRAPNFLPS